MPVCLPAAALKSRPESKSTSSHTNDNGADLKLSYLDVSLMQNINSTLQLCRLVWWLSASISGKSTLYSIFPLFLWSIIARLLQFLPHESTIRRNWSKYLSTLSDIWKFHIVKEKKERIPVIEWHYYLLYCKILSMGQYWQQKVVAK